MEILNPDGTANFTSQLKEKPLDDLSKEKEDLILPPFNAYSAQGVITVSKQFFSGGGGFFYLNILKQFFSI